MENAACRQATNCTRRSAGYTNSGLARFLNHELCPFYLSRNLYFRITFYNKSYDAVKQAVASGVKSIARFARKWPPCLQSIVLKKYHKPHPSGGSVMISECPQQRPLESLDCL